MKVKNHSKLCTTKLEGDGKWWSKKKTNSECKILGSFSGIGAYPTGYKWLCPKKLSNSAGKADKTSLMILLDTIKCGLDACFDA